MMHEFYCEILGKEVGLLKKKIEVSVNFGQKKGLIESKNGIDHLNSKSRTVNQKGLIL